MIPHPFLLSLQVGLTATFASFIVGLTLALVFTRTQFRGSSIIETIVYLPMVLPPSVVGFYLLLFLGENGPVVRLLNLNILFTQTAAIVASTVVAIPLMVMPARAAIASINPTLENAARTLGSSELKVLCTVTLPLAKRGIIAGIVLSFARAVGEFGATLMVASNTPGRTQTLPLAIADAVWRHDISAANAMVFVMTLFSLVAVILANRLQQTRK